jgi:prevent-host-death family protein
MRFANVRELKNKTSELLRAAARGSDVLITSHGRPVGILHGLTEDELEDYVFLHHRGLRRSLDDAEDEYRRKGGISLETLLARLEKKRDRP